MTDAGDMSTPVTRGELREELQELRQELQQEFRHGLEMWGGALLARIQSGERLIAQLSERIDGSEQRLIAELARHTRASHEATLAHISACLEPFAGLPERVSRLEAVVFPSTPR
jgi:hypothetical protein